MMKTYQLNCEQYHDIYNEIYNKLEDSEFGVNFRFLEKENGLTDDTLFATDKEIEIESVQVEDFEKTDYAMFIINSKYNGWYQEFFLYLFNTDEIDLACELQYTFNKDEIKYMENFEDEEEI
ncbi:hypothetical protein KQI68_07245 [Peptoniphilus sp. MSJ-1]|uniref:Uncharacterized protein n=1 Tax=Peptoniphilus ovalis TaxID=2841503 RepID=A0ABS6FHZ4_9FIRM|nr:hypothetical protein [Peptoniphilus ovalis]MBU5669634.1 hypothetical protein [Peptoniphilus ovalis]